MRYEQTLAALLSQLPRNAVFSQASAMPPCLNSVLIRVRERVMRLFLTGGLRARFRKQAHRPAQMALGAIERRLGLSALVSLQQQEGELDAAAGPLQSLPNLFAVAAGKARQDLFAAVNELFVRSLNVHHESVVYAAHQDHDEGGKQQQRDALRRARLHPCRARDGLRARVEEDRMV